MTIKTEFDCDSCGEETDIVYTVEQGQSFVCGECFVDNYNCTESYR